MQKNLLPRIKKKKEKIDLKNEAESYIYTTEKLVTQDLKDKITQEQGIKVTDAIKELRGVIDKDVEQLKPKLDALKSTVNEITTELYKNVNPPSGAEQQTGEEQAGSSQQGEQEQKSETQQEEPKSGSAN